ncbi:MAG: hypothetical protein M1298_03940, partial [Chloroflexi bacterium]|nr:hypothetical protein [Chloroflexota bacterium]
MTAFRESQRSQAAEESLPADWSILKQVAQQRFSRHQALRMLAGVMAGGVVSSILAACGASSSSTAATAVSTATASTTTSTAASTTKASTTQSSTAVAAAKTSPLTAPTTVTAGFYTAASQKRWQQLMKIGIPEFEKTHKTIKVQWQPEPPTHNIMEKMVTMYAAGTAPDVVGDCCSTLP